MNKGLPKIHTVSHYLHIWKSAICIEVSVWRHFRHVRKVTTKLLLTSSYFSVRTSSRNNPPLTEVNFSKFYCKDFIKIHCYNWISVQIWKNNSHFTKRPRYVYYTLQNSSWIGWSFRKKCTEKKHMFNHIRFPSQHAVWKIIAINSQQPARPKK